MKYVNKIGMFFKFFLVRLPAKIKISNFNKLCDLAAFSDMSIIGLQMIRNKIKTLVKSGVTLET